MSRLPAFLRHDSFGVDPVVAGALAVVLATSAAPGTVAPAAAWDSPGRLLWADAPPAGSPRANTTMGSTAIRNVGWRSSNWGGYVLQHGPYRSVSGRWTVPHISSSTFGYSAMWIGIDGVGQRHLIQTGTEQDTRGGTSHYFAWWEILPAPAVRIASISVLPGDRMSATIEQVAAGRWRITITDVRSGTFTTVRSYTGSGASAEWIEETPVVDNQLVPLARHGPVAFDHAAVNGANARLGPANAGALVRRGAQILTPSIPDADRDGFRIRETRSAPLPPTS